MLRKILMLVMIMVMTSMGAASAAEKLIQSLTAVVASACLKIIW